MLRRRISGRIYAALAPLLSSGCGLMGCPDGSGTAGCAGSVVVAAAATLGLMAGRWPMNSTAQRERCCCSRRGVALFTYEAMLEMPSSSVPIRRMQLTSQVVCGMFF